MSGFSIVMTMDPATGMPKRLHTMAGRAGIPPRAPFKLIAAHMMTSVNKTFQQQGQEAKWPRGHWMGRGGRLMQDTGRLKKSITFRVSGDRVEIGTSDIRARLLHRGGIVRPKHGKFLAIPWDSKIKRSPREYEDTFVTHGIIFQKVGKRGKPRPLFTLVRQVTIPARPIIEITGADRAYITETLGKHYAGEN